VTAESPSEPGEPAGDSWFDEPDPGVAPRRTLGRVVVMLLGAAFLGASLAIGAISIDRGAVPPFRPSLAEVDLAQVTRGDKGVRVKGVAHYAGMVELRSRDGAHVVYLYPLLSTYDGHDAHAVVRTHRKPGRLVELETVEVEGIARHPRFLLPWDAWEVMVGRGYRFDDDYVLIDAFD
jgi:hypothetical protein